jgi:hypothetical protein
MPGLKGFWYIPEALYRLNFLEVLEVFLPPLLWERVRGEGFPRLRGRGVGLKKYIIG